MGRDIRTVQRRATIMPTRKYAAKRNTTTRGRTLKKATRRTTTMSKRGTTTRGRRSG